MTFNYCNSSINKADKSKLCEIDIYLIKTQNLLIIQTFEI